MPPRKLPSGTPLKRCKKKQSKKISNKKSRKKSKSRKNSKSKKRRTKKRDSFTVSAQKAWARDKAWIRRMNRTPLLGHDLNTEPNSIKRMRKQLVRSKKGNFLNKKQYKFENVKLNKDDLMRQDLKVVDIPDFSKLKSKK